MPQHEQKTCPRCHQPFQCKVGDVTHCDCSTIHLTPEERTFIESRYNDCLCINCLKQLKNKQVLFLEKFLGK